MTDMLVKYTGNADDFTATQAVTLGAGRPALVRGGDPVEISSEEYANLVGHGVVLEVIGDGYDDLKVDDLRSRLDDLGVDHSDAKKKDDLVKLLRSNSASGEVPPPAVIEGPLNPTPGGPGSATTTVASGVGVGQTGGGAA